MHLIYEENDVRVRLRILHDRLETFFELPMLRGSGHECRHVKGPNPETRQFLRNIAPDYPVREALDDCSLSGARRADQNRVVLGLAGEDLKDTAYLAVATDHGLYPSLFRKESEIACISLQMLHLRFSFIGLLLACRRLRWFPAYVAVAESGHSLADLAFIHAESICNFTHGTRHNAECPEDMLQCHRAAVPAEFLCLDEHFNHIFRELYTAVTGVLHPGKRVRYRLAEGDTVHIHALEKEEHHLLSFLDD